MKKYKLIKTYQGSPELGTEISKAKYHNHYNFNGGNFNNAIPIDIVENNPSFWKEIIEDPIVYHIGNSLNESHSGSNHHYYIYGDTESYCKRNKYKYFHCKKDCEKWAKEQVVEKDYEILSFKSNCNCIAYVQLDSKYSLCEINKKQKGHYTVKEMLNLDCTKYIIHSILRKSDGEVFTVGDKVSCKGYANTTVTKITIEHNDLCLWGKYINEMIGYLSLKDDIQHIKNPLFTTFDNVDIYEGDKFWYVNNIHNGCYLLNETIAKKNNKESSKVEGILDFSTKQAAEEYILMNKPCLSIEDVQKNMFNIIGKDYYAAITYQLIKEVKKGL